jgi:Saxitoxin biosynthesis operon protein SxtJ
MGSDRSFGLVFSGFFLLIALFPLTGGGGLRWWAVAVSAAFAVMAFVRPSWLRPLNVLWFRFGLLLNRIVSPVVMGILFFLVVTPIGVLRRIRNPDPLRQQFDTGSASYWLKVDQSQPKSSMRRQF